MLVPAVLAVRINHEERLLRRDLDGYEEYCRKVKNRLVPFVW
jgi:protein-S-isoprenylcysteine O-methyltransferase Ste14